MLDNWSGMDKEKVKDYILHCQVCKNSASTSDGKIVSVWNHAEFDEVAGESMIFFYRSTSVALVKIMVAHCDSVKLTVNPKMHLTCECVRT